MKSELIAEAYNLIRELYALNDILGALDQQDEAENGNGCGHLVNATYAITPTPAACRSIRSIMRADFFQRRQAILDRLKELDVELPPPPAPAESAPKPN